MAPVRAAEPTEPLSPRDVIKTYRYLRIGFIGAVVLLATSIAYERSKVDCWQTSISAYYYTPVRAIFVGCMVAAGLLLIVYKGRSYRSIHLRNGAREVRANIEDIFLNFAGMFAPVVAIAPTTDVGRCWSLAPSPLPVESDGSLADWVVTNIGNNFHALLIAGGIGLTFAAILLVSLKRGIRSALKDVDHGTLASLAVTALVLLIGLWLSWNWSDFYTRAHGYAAVLMFLFLIGSILAVIREHAPDRDRVWFRLYSAMAAVMVLGALFLWLTRIAGDHTVFALEAYEITLFAVYWGIQTKENWHGHVEGTDPVVVNAGSATR